MSAFVAVVVVAFVGVEQGVLLAVVIAVIDVLRRQYSPDESVLLRDGQLDERLQGRVPAPHGLEGVLVYRFGAELFFENASHFADRVRSLVAGASTPVTLLVLDCAAMSDIDYSGAATLRQLSEELAPTGTMIVLTELSANARATVESMGLEPDVSVVARLEDAVRSGTGAEEGTSA